MTALLEKWLSAPICGAIPISFLWSAPSPEGSCVEIVRLPFGARFTRVCDIDAAILDAHDFGVYFERFDFLRGRPGYAALGSLLAALLGPFIQPRQNAAIGAFVLINVAAFGLAIWFALEIGGLDTVAGLAELLAGLGFGLGLQLPAGILPGAADRGT